MLARCTTPEGVAYERASPLKRAIGWARHRRGRAMLGNDRGYVLLGTPFAPVRPGSYHPRRSRLPHLRFARLPFAIWPPCNETLNES